MILLCSKPYFKILFDLGGVSFPPMFCAKGNGVFFIYFSIKIVRTLSVRRPSSPPGEDLDDFLQFRKHFNCVGWLEMRDRGIRQFEFGVPKMLTSSLASPRQGHPASKHLLGVDLFSEWHHHHRRRQAENQYF